MARNDEHTLNTALAACLRSRSPAWRQPNALTAEDLGALEGSGRPDILADAGSGAPVAVETEFSPARTVERDARNRLGRLTVRGGRIENAVAVRMPTALRDVPPEELVDQVTRASYTFAVLSADAPKAETNGAETGWTRFPVEGWIEGGVNDLAGLVEILEVSERAVAASTDILQTTVRHAAGQLARDLTQDKQDVLRRLGEYLVQAPGEQTNRMAMAIVANACTFHAALAGSLGIRDFESIGEPGRPLSRREVLVEWREILKINYWPIFRTASQILAHIPSATAARVLGLLVPAAERLAAEGASSSHDLTGRMFQQLIQDRKFLATFYTRPESATLLTELGVATVPCDWSEPDGVYRLRVADLACGTGTLIAAAYHALIRRYRRAGWDDREVHDSMLERCLIAADVMPAATHLTASMLSSVHPGVPYARTQVYTLPYGDHPEVDRPCLGSLNLLGAGEVLNLFGTGLAAGIEGLGAKGAEAVSAAAIADESLDLVVMNPPFTRPTNHEITDERVPSFAGFSRTEEEQRAMSSELKRLRNRLVRDARRDEDAPPASDGNAGLASNFLDLAHAKLRRGGTLALVMPASLALGGSWSAGRTLLARHYENLLIVSLSRATSEDASFSADTGMAEILLLARKRRQYRPELGPATAAATWISLKRRPRSAVEGYETSRAIRRQVAESPTTPATVFEVRLGDQLGGTGIRATLGDGGCSGISDLSLAQTAIRLRHGNLLLPRSGRTTTLPTVRLGELGRRGPVHRDIGGRRRGASFARGPFEIVALDGVPTFPALWGHNAGQERRLLVLPDSMGTPLPGRQADAASVWKTAARLHFSLDFRLNSQSLAACITAKRTLGGRAWPSFRTGSSDWEEPLAAWANTTLGLFLFWWIGSAQHAGRAVLTITRLPDLPVLDLRKLSEEQRDRLRAAFTALSGQDFLPAHRAHEDPARKELDRLVLEEALGFDAEAMDQVALLREKWCAEPTVHGGKRS